MRVIVHIGSTKTGSSSLQNFLYANREMLADQGVLYPDVGVKSGAHHVLVSTIHQSAFSLHRNEVTQSREDLLDGFCSELQKQIENFDGHTLLLSSEYLWTLNKPENFAAFLARLGITDFEVVCYVREVTAWLRSQFKQAVVSGNKLRFYPWLRKIIALENSGVHYAKLLDKWRNVEAVNGITARLYHQETLKNGLFADFLTFLRVPCEAFDLSKHQNHNPSRPDGLVDLLAATNNSDLDQKDRDRIRNYILKHAPMVTKFEYRPVFLKREHDLLQGEIQSEIERFRTEYLIEEHRSYDLFDQTTISPQDRIETISNDLVLMLADLLRKHEKLIS